MGRRGPAPEPVAAKIARGETRPSRVNFGEPKPRLKAPAMPRDMDAIAKLVWRRTMREQATGLIRAVDTDLLRAYCEAVSRYQGAIRAYMTGQSVEGGIALPPGPLIASRGGVVKNPLHQIVRDNADTIRLLARELGIGPSSRAGMQIEGFGAGGGPSSIADEIGPAPRFRVVGGSDVG